MWSRLFCIVAGLTVGGLPSFGTPVSETSLAGREAQESRNPAEPQLLSEVYGSIEAGFGLSFAVESLPERCVGGPGNDQKFPPFSFERGELFGDVISRFEMRTGYRWMLDVICGIPILRRNPDVVDEPVLLDLAVSLKVTDVSIWEALCALAREVNGKALADSTGKTLYIHLDGPESLRFPPPIFQSGPRVTLAFNDVPARGALCAILETAKSSFTYFYICGPDDHLTILQWGEDGEVVHGPRMEDTPADKEAMAYFEDANIRKLQSPPVPNVTTGSMVQEPKPETAGRGGGWRLIVCSGSVVAVMAAVSMVGMYRRSVRK